MDVRWNHCMVLSASSAVYFSVFCWRFGGVAAALAQALFPQYAVLRLGYSFIFLKKIKVYKEDVELNVFSHLSCVVIWFLWL